MHEYIYLSQKKVSQFVPADRPWWRRLREKKLAAGVGVGVAKLDVELEHRDPEQLTDAQLEKVLETIDERSSWYEEQAGAGDWVVFEGRLGIHVVDEGPAAGAVLFYGLAEHPTARRVLLHGTSTNLSTPPVPLAPAAAAAVRPPGGFSGAEAFPLVVRAAEQAMAPAEEGLWQTLAGLLRRSARSNPLPGEVNEQVTALFGHIDGSEWHTATAPYAVSVLRVTALLRPPGSAFETLVGSPLFVRSVRP